MTDSTTLASSSAIVDNTNHVLDYKVRTMKGQDPESYQKLVEAITARIKTRQWKATSHVPPATSELISLCNSCVQFTGRLTKMFLRDDRIISYRGDDKDIALSLEEKCALCQFFRQILELSFPKHDFSSDKVALKCWTSSVQLRSGYHCHITWGENLLETDVWVCRESPGGETPFPATNSKRVPPQMEVDYVKVKQWISTCEKKHEKCRDAFEKAKIPDFRVIDCANKVIVPLPADNEYVTLSYVWGSPSTGGSFPSNLPVVIEDTITVTLQLGYRYLWVDQYCIPQDNDAVKQAQLGKMGMIYRNSCLTIIAASSKSASDGLPGVSNASRSPIPCFSIGADTVSPNDMMQSPQSLTFMPVLAMLGSRAVRHSKWNTRGWTYQEALLSRRRLVFTQTQTLFQCLEGSTEESIPVSNADTPYLGTPGITGGPNFDNFSSGYAQLDRFQSMVQSYIIRELSYPSDFLWAFQGILAAFKNEAYPIRNLCGIPISEFPHENNPNTFIFSASLFWDWLVHRDERAWLTAPQRRTGFPSWSWLGWVAAKHDDIWWANYPRNTLSNEFYCDIEMAVELADGSVIFWESHAEELLSNHNAPDAIKCLRVTGSIFTLEFGRSCVSTNAPDNFKIEGCTVSKNSAGKVVAIAESLGYLNRGGHKVGGSIPAANVISLPCLVMKYKIAKYVGVGVDVMVLGLNPATKSYERLGVLTLDVMGEKHVDDFGDLVDEAETWDEADFESEMEKWLDSHDLGDTESLEEDEEDLWEKVKSGQILSSITKEPFQRQEIRLV